MPSNTFSPLHTCYVSISQSKFPLRLYQYIRKGLGNIMTGLGAFLYEMTSLSFSVTGMKETPRCTGPSLRIK